MTRTAHFRLGWGAVCLARVTITELPILLGESRTKRLLRMILIALSVIMILSGMFKVVSSLGLILSVSPLVMLGIQRSKVLQVG